MHKPWSGRISFIFFFTGFSIVIGCLESMLESLESSVQYGTIIRPACIAVEVGKSAAVFSVANCFRNGISELPEIKTQKGNEAFQNGHKAKFIGKIKTSGNVLKLKI